jgi:glycosyltransferase involved in cell wall biosynthesis
MPPSRLPLSAVLITRNAARQLPDCLASLDFCDDIVVIDSGSEDGTGALARQLGARVIEQALHDWVLCIDADERVSMPLRDAILAALIAPAQPAHRFARCNRFMGRYLRHGEGYPDWCLRLFDRRQARWSDDAVHEKVLTDAAVGTLAGDLLHESAESIESYLAKQNRYSTLAAETAINRGKRANFGHLLLSPTLRFIKFYFFRLGFVDGLPGLVHILIGCGASFAKYAKMLAMQRERS